MSMSKRCDIFPNSRGPAHEYRLRFVKIVAPANDPEDEPQEEVMFTATRDMGLRAFDRAINGMKVAMEPLKKKSEDAAPTPKTKDVQDQTLFQA